MSSVRPFEIVAALLALLCVVVMACGLLYLSARITIWWRNRRPPTLYIEQMPRWEVSDREKR